MGSLEQQLEAAVKGEKIEIPVAEIQEWPCECAAAEGPAKVKAAHLRLTDEAAADIIEQADWYKSKADRKLADRWQTAVTSAALRIFRNPRSARRAGLVAQNYLLAGACNRWIS